MDIIGDILGGMTGSFGSSSSSGGDPNWAAIERLMQMDTEMNRTDRVGSFSGWEWGEDPETGKWTQTQTLQPGMQYGVDRLIGRSQGAGMDPYQSPDQFSQLLDAKMANQMDRHGIDTSGYTQSQEGPPQPWQPSGQNPSMNPYVTPPPEGGYGPQGGPQATAPVGGGGGPLPDPNAQEQMQLPDDYYAPGFGDRRVSKYYRPEHEKYRGVEGGYEDYEGYRAFNPGGKITG